MVSGTLPALAAREAGAWSSDQQGRKEVWQTRVTLDLGHHDRVGTAAPATIKQTQHAKRGPAIAHM